MTPTCVQLIIANKSGKFLEGNSAATMSAEQQLERPSRFKAGARGSGEGSHSSIAATALLGEPFAGKEKMQL